MTLTTVTRTYLEMTSPGELIPGATPDPTPQIARVEQCSVALFRFLYREVGRAYRWTDRLGWDDKTIAAYLSDPDVSMWLLSWQAIPAGYFELRRHPDDGFEIAYFGLLPNFIGRGWGKYLLTRAVTAAWELGATRVWLHTCTLDHPAALPNYLKRGFRPVRREVYHVSVAAGKGGSGEGTE
ncbi:MAG TPA: GNAT family N-acetyltransferase [Gemmatimonadales bacterium]